MEREETKHKVFISYSRKDYIDESGKEIKDNIISKIKECFNEHNVTYWLDKEGIYSSQDYSAKINEAIKQSRVILFISSKNSNSSTWTCNEIITAIKYEKSIIPFKIDNSPYNNSLELYLTPINSIEYNNDDESMELLIRDLNHLIEEDDSIKPTDNLNSTEQCNHTRSRNSTESNQPSTGKFNKWHKWLFWALLLALPIAALGCYAWNQKNRPMIIFAGGGSAANFIKALTKDKIDVNDYPNSIYLNLPSESAWTLLAEEVNRMGSGNPFISICVSADSIDFAFIKSQKARNLFDNGRVISYYLGEDTLKVYVSKDFPTISGINLINMNTITTQELATIIDSIKSNPNKARIFTTSKGSGTLRAYQRNTPKAKIDLNIMLDSNQCHQYIQSSSSTYIESLDTGPKLPYIILGSCFYKADCIEESQSQYQSLFVKDGDHIVTKPMYVYFVAHNKGDKKNCFVYKPIIDFLKILNKRGVNDYSILDKDKWNVICEKGSITYDSNKIIELRKNIR